MPVVSVIIPTFNRAPLLGRAIQSVIDQTFHDWELFVVDDGSVDETTDVVGSFDDPRIRYLRHQDNLGAAAARNTAIKVCNGEYLAFLGSDDEWLPEKLERQLSVVKESESQGGSIAAVICGYLSTESGQTKIVLSSNPEWSYEDLLAMRVGPWGDAMLLVRRGVPEVFYDVDLPAAHDWDFLVQVSKRGRIIAMPEPLIRVNRVHGDHVSSSKNVRSARLRILEKYGAELNAQPKVLAIHHIRLAVICHNLGDRLGVRRHLAAAIRANRQDPRPYLWYLGAIFGGYGLRATLKLIPYKKKAVETIELTS